MCHIALKYIQCVHVFFFYEQLIYTRFRKDNIFDNMVTMMEIYQSHLEDLVTERTAELEEEQKTTESLLHRMLPK